MGKAFSNTTNLTQIPGIENWNTSSATDMNDMFANSSVTSLDISKWDLTQALNIQTGSLNQGVKNMFGGSKIVDITIPSGVNLEQTNLSALNDIWKEAGTQNGNLLIKEGGFSNSAKDLIENNAKQSKESGSRRFLRGYFMATIKHGDANINCLVNTNGKHNFVDAIVNCKDSNNKITDFRNLGIEKANATLSTILGLKDEVITDWNNGNSAFNTDLSNLDLSKDFNLTVKTKSIQKETSNVVEPSRSESSDHDSDSDYSLNKLLFIPFNKDDYNYSSYNQTSVYAKTYTAEQQKIAEPKTAESAKSQQENQDTSYKAEIANKTATNKNQTEQSSNSISNNADYKDLQSNDSKENNSKDNDSSKSVNKKKDALTNNSYIAKAASSTNNTHVLAIAILVVFVVAIAGIATFTLKKN